jgi:hypothetical protein
VNAADEFQRQWDNKFKAKTKTKPVRRKEAPKSAIDQVEEIAKKSELDSVLQAKRAKLKENKDLLK